MIQQKREVFHEFKPQGAASQLFLTKDPEVLLEGPAGTG